MLTMTRFFQGRFQGSLPLLSASCPKRETGNGLLCRCLQVTQDEVVLAVKQANLKTVEDVRQHTGAATGCLACLKKLKTLVEQLTQPNVESPENPAAKKAS